MQLNELAGQADLTAVQQHGEAEVVRIVADSRQAGPKTLFAALRGTHDDGHRFIHNAIDAGAAAVLCEDSSALPENREIPFLVVPDARDAYGRCAQALAGWPARKLTIAGVTGTNGKTTVSHLLQAILQQGGIETGMIGTICYQTGQRRVDARMTTPDPTDIAEMMAEMVAAGQSHLVMEASSHALHQRRTAGIDFAVGIFTNITGDHLDYHGTMADYLAAKRLLFEQLDSSAVAVINRDDPYADALADVCSAELRWYGLNALADLQGIIEQIDAAGTHFHVLCGDRRHDVRTSMIGRHNVYNALAALTAADALGVPLDQACSALQQVQSVPGRLQRVPTGGSYQVFIDYAHTDDALQNVLSALRPITPGRIIVVFGCGGDRDRTKRPRMARVADELADTMIVTSDNPRSEDPQAIVDDILSGLDDAARAGCAVRIDRREAIGLAIEQAEPDDVVLIAGKGHETYQIIGTERMHFDDREIAAECIARREDFS